MYMSQQVQVQLKQASLLATQSIQVWLHVSEQMTGYQSVLEIQLRPAAAAYPLLQPISLYGAALTPPPTITAQFFQISK
jgi:hypothetical protein